MNKKIDKKVEKRNSHSRKILKRIGISLIFVFTFSYFAIGGYVAYTVTLVEDHEPDDGFDSGTCGKEYSTEFFKARGDDLTIAAWYIPNPEAERAIIMVHGRNANKQTAISGLFPILGCDIHDAGFAVLMIDTRGHGESEGKRYSFGVYERRDVLGAVDWLIEKGFSSGKIGALGISNGNTTVIGAAAEEKAIGALALDSAFADINPLFTEGWDRDSPSIFWPAILIMWRIMFGYDLRDVIPANEIVDIPPRPILLLHCLNDYAVPFSQAEDLKSAVPGTELIKFENCDHAELYRDFPQKYLDAVIPFFQESIE